MPLKKVSCLLAFTVLGQSLPYNSVPSGAFLIPLKRVVNQTAYGATMQIGSPPQTLTVLADTGSSTLGFPGKTSNVCEDPGHLCAKYGVYDNATSSTAVYVNSKYFDELSNFGSGDYIKDTVRVGGKTFPKTVFGDILYYGGSDAAINPTIGIFGLAPLCGNNTCKPSGKGDLTLQQNLLSRGLIKSNVVSIYLGPEEANAEGELLYSAIDTAKQDGTVLTLPVLNPGTTAADGSAINANYSSVTISTNGNKDQNIHIPNDAFAFLDTGNPAFDMPPGAFTYVANYFGITKKTPQSVCSGAYDVDCKFRQQQADNATLLVGFGADKLKIRIPFNRFVTQLSPTHCVADILECRTMPLCSFGDPFIRSTYLSFDFDALTVKISNAKYTAQRHIIPA